MYENWNQDSQSNLGYEQEPVNVTEASYENAANNIVDEKPEKKKKKKGGVGKMIAHGAVFGLSAAVVFCTVVGVAKNTFLKTEQTVAKIETEKESESKTVENTQTATTLSTAAKTEDGLTIAQIAENCMPSIVSITNSSVSEVRSMFGTKEYESTSCGSGIIIGQNDTELLIATNNHVVESAESLSVCFGDSEDAVYEAQIKGTEAENDLAIVAVELEDIDSDVLSTIKIATIGSSGDLAIGDTVIAIGNALGYGQSVTTGIVSALDREVNIDNLSAKLIQTDAAINPGNSGGALLNAKGELIGINSAKFASSEVEGMGYAIPIDTAEPILEELMMRETRNKLETNESGYLGINCQNVDDEVSEMYGIPKGVYVLSVEEGTAAANAGLQKADIITKFDGISIGSREELKNTLLYYSAGEVVEITIQRAVDGAYTEMTLSVTLDRNTLDEATSEESGQYNGNQYGNGGGSFYGYDNSDIESFFNQFGIY